MTNVDLDLAMFIADNMKQMRESVDAYPASCSSLEEWKSILETIEFGFRTYLENVGEPQNFQPHLDKSLWLLMKHFTDLW